MAILLPQTFNRKCIREVSARFLLGRQHEVERDMARSEVEREDMYLLHHEEIEGNLAIKYAGNQRIISS